MQSPEPRKNKKENLHPRNKHRSRYDFPALILSCKELEPYVSANEHHELSIDFTDAAAVRALNKALLKHFYKVDLWDIPEGYLCPPIPGRADYIHYLADLITSEEGTIPKGKGIKVFDIGVGANCIYPLIGHKQYGWSFVGSEIDHLAIRSAKNIVEANGLSKAISIRKQSSAAHILEGVIHHGEHFDLTMCNPPFHSSLQESLAGTQRKWKNLGKPDGDNPLNFGGKNSELWCEGGERRFVLQMIAESVPFAHSVGWFTSLISQKETLAACYAALEKVQATHVQTIEMSQGQKVSRILAWTFKA